MPDLVPMRLLVVVAPHLAQFLLIPLHFSSCLNLVLSKTSSTASTLGLHVARSQHVQMVIDCFDRLAFLELVIDYRTCSHGVRVCVLVSAYTPQNEQQECMKTAHLSM